MTNYADLLPYLIPELTGCSSNVITQRIKTTVLDFCTRSGAYWADLTAIDIVAEQSAYTLTAPASTKIDRVAGVVLNDVNLETTKYEVVDDASGWTLTLDDEPQAASTGGLEVTVVVLPLITATSIPAYLMDRWNMKFCAGVKANLMLMKQKPWTDRELALQYMREYNAGIAEARNLTMKGMKNHSLRVTIPSF